MLVNGRLARSCIIPNVRVDARCVRDNNLQGGAFRGYGINQAAIVEVDTATGEVKLLKAADTPIYQLILIEDPESIGPYGAKGISEVATVPITPAILNAISRAIGARINKVPATPEVIRRAMKGECR